MIRDLARLFRLRLAFLNGVSAVGGYSLFPAQAQTEPLLMAFFGIVLLAMGGSALNQVLERDIDAVMERTMQRPLPLGRFSVSTAFIAGFCVILGGLVLLALNSGPLPPLLGIVALVWYLTVYTPLKRKTTLALPIGALCGVFPPLIGWCLAGGVPNDFRIITLAGMLYLWQIPHFWLLQERHEADYLRAGIPLYGQRFIVTGRAHLFWLWLMAFITGTMLLPVFGVIGRPAALWFTVFPLLLILLTLLRSKRLLFAFLNLFPVLVTLLLLL